MHQRVGHSRLDGWHCGVLRYGLAFPLSYHIAFGLRSGDLKENITTAGLDLYSLPPGQLLRVGAAVLTMTGPCAPCKLVEDLRPGLRQVLAGRRGMLARVVEAGEIRLGDAIETD